jgi:hypothetical protein
MSWLCDFSLVRINLRMVLSKPGGMGQLFIVGLFGLGVK